jgi:hypothetical protein
MSLRMLSWVGQKRGAGVFECVLLHVIARMRMCLRERVCVS